MCRNQQRKSRKVKKQGNIFQTKEDKSPETNLSEMEVSDLPHRVFKITVLNMVTKVREQCMNKVRISTKRKKILKNTKQKSQNFRIQ